MSKHNNSKIPGTRAGEFIGAARKGDNVTIWVEGRSEDGPSVAGISLNLESVETLILRLQRIREQWPKD